MKKLDPDELREYVEKNIGVFHEKRILSLDSLKLNKVLSRKNPYLFKAKNFLTAADIVKALIDAHLSSNEETIFGDWLEGLAIFINQKVFGGWKSGIPGIDLEFDNAGIRYIITIKSGPNWGNSSQINKMVSDFNSAKKTLKTSHSKLHIEAVNGCCYGKDTNPLKEKDYYKYCGQTFWAFISGDTNLYIDIIEPLGNQAKEKNDKFYESYAQMINKFTIQFASEFCKENGEIDWPMIVKFNSGTK